MDKNKAFLNSNIISYEVAEDDNFCDITTRLCYLNDYNLNGFCLNESDKTEDCVQTLVNTPVLAYYNSKKDDFEGHKVKSTKNGYTFGTQAIGTHTSAWIQTDKVTPVFSNEEIELPCIYGTARIWKSRFPKFYEVLKRRLENNQMNTSWELQASDTQEDENVENKNIPNPRSCTEWVFLGNALLGVTAAYQGTSQVIEISEEDNLVDLELSEALSKDIEENDNQEEVNNSNNESIENIITNTVKETISQLFPSSKEEVNIINKNDNKGGKDSMSKKKNEVSTVTMMDLHNKLSEAVCNKTDYWCCLSMVFPEDRKCWCYRWDRESELDFMEFTYSVDENDVVSVSDPIAVKLTALPAITSTLNANTPEASQVIIQLDETAKLLSQKEIKISELEKTVSEKEIKISQLETEISTKIESINTLGEEIANKDTIISQKDSVIAELTPLKEEKERLEAEKEAQILAQKKADLKAYATKNGYITEEEIEVSEEIKKAIDELDERTIKIIRAERIEKKFETKEVEAKPEVETSSATTSTKAETSTIANLSNADENLLSATDIIKNMLKKNKTN